MTHLATQADVEATIGRSLTSNELLKLDSLLGRASALIRATCGNNPFTIQTNVDTLVARGSEITLYKRPVLSVATVKLNLPVQLGQITLAAWSWDRKNSIFITPWNFVANLPEILNDIELEYRVLSYEVTYDSGYATVPEDVVGVCAQSVSRAYQAPTPGLQSETIGGYSYRMADGYTTGVPSLTPDDLLILERYDVGRAAWSAELGR